MKSNALLTIVYANLRNYIRSTVLSLLIPITMFFIMQLIYTFINSKLPLNKIGTMMPGSGITGYIRLDNGKNIIAHDYVYSVFMLMIIFQSCLISMQQTIFKVRSSGYIKYLFIGNVSNYTFLLGFLCYGTVLGLVIFTIIQLVFAPFILPYFSYSIYLLLTLVAYAAVLSMLAIFLGLVVNSQIVMGFINAFINLLLMFTSGFFMGKNKFNNIPIIEKIFDYNPLYHLILQFRSFYFGFYQNGWFMHILFAFGAIVLLWCLCLLRLHFGRQAVILNAI